MRLQLKPAVILSSFISFLFLIVLSGARDASAEPKKYRLGDIALPEEVYKAKMKRDKKTPLGMALPDGLPVSYNAMTDGFVTSPKDQGNCGSCWAFASTGAFESHLIKEGYAEMAMDLAEQQQVSCNTAMLGCQGGSSTAIRYWEDKGPLYEIYFPYTASDSTMCMEAEQLQYSITDFHTVPMTVADFKNSLYTYGPSYWRYDVYNDFFTFWGTYQPGAVYVNQSRTFAGGHAVLLIGWDDTKQAFLCKNSWGDGGPNGDGTFWIAYGGHLKNLNFGMANFSIGVSSVNCSTDLDCDDGIYCNGQEVCSYGYCLQGSPVVCEDNGAFCDGVEFCDESSRACAHSDDACETGETCDEVNDQCILESCGNGECEIGESCINCPGDCISGSGGGECENCFKGTCDGSCHPIKEDGSCADCSPSYCCGDGACTVSYENVDNCLIDCGCSSDADCDDGDACTTDVCSNGVCQNAWPACGADDQCCAPGCTADNDPNCGPVLDCSACFKGVCDGSCNPRKDGPGCPDCP